MKWNDIGAKPSALALVALDGSRDVRDEQPAGNHEVSSLRMIQLDQPRPRRTRLAWRQPDIVADIVAKSDRRDSLFGRQMGVQGRAVESHWCPIANGRGCAPLDKFLGFWLNKEGEDDDPLEWSWGFSAFAKPLFFLFFWVFTSFLYCW